MGVNLMRLRQWRELCRWLEAQPYNAAYPAAKPFPHPELVASSDWAREERRYVRLIYWDAGLGWRLHAGYRERLDALTAERRHLLNGIVTEGELPPLCQSIIAIARDEREHFRGQTPRNGRPKALLPVQKVLNAYRETVTPERPQGNINEVSRRTGINKGHVWRLLREAGVIDA